MEAKTEATQATVTAPQCCILNSLSLSLAPVLSLCADLSGAEQQSCALRRGNEENAFAARRGEQFNFSFAGRSRDTVSNAHTPHGVLRNKFSGDKIIS